MTRSVITRIYLWCVVALAAIAFMCWAILVGFTLGTATIGAGLALALLCAVERLWPVSFGVGRATFEFGGIPIFAALVLGGPGCAMLVAVPSAAYRDPSRTAFQAATHVLQILAGGLVLLLVGPVPLLSAPDGLHIGAPFIWGTLVAGGVFFGLDAVIGPVLMHLKYNLAPREVFREVVLAALPSDVLAIVATVAAAFAAASSGPFAALVLLAGCALSLTAIERVRSHRKRTLRLEAENAALREALRDSNLELASRLVARLGSRDGRAAAHAAASAVYAHDIAAEMGFDEDHQEQIRLAALFMDVGLLWVPDEVLITDPDKLNSVGRMHFEAHPVAGEELLSAVPGLGEAARWVRWHHERPDGAGYPDRLRGDWTPIEAKILAVVSLYASLVLDGTHSPGIRPDEARRMLVEGMGETVDASVVKAFLLVLDSRDAAYASAADARFLYQTVSKDTV